MLPKLKGGVTGRGHCAGPLCLELENPNMVSKGG